jgi:hypothetical protein
LKKFVTTAVTLGARSAGIFTPSVRHASPRPAI